MNRFRRARLYHLLSATLETPDKALSNQSRSESSSADFRNLCTHMRAVLTGGAMAALHACETVPVLSRAWGWGSGDKARNLVAVFSQEVLFAAIRSWCAEQNADPAGSFATDIPATMLLTSLGNWSVETIEGFRARNTQYQYEAKLREDTRAGRQERYPNLGNHILLSDALSALGRPPLINHIPTEGYPYENLSDMETRGGASFSLLPDSLINAELLRVALALGYSTYTDTLRRIAVEPPVVTEDVVKRHKRPAESEGPAESKRGRRYRRLR